MKNLLELNIKRWDCVFIISWRSLTTAALTGLYKIYISKKIRSMIIQLEMMTAYKRYNKIHELKSCRSSTSAVFPIGKAYSNKIILQRPFCFIRKTRQGNKNIVLEKRKWITFPRKILPLMYCGNESLVSSFS